MPLKSYHLDPLSNTVPDSVVIFLHGLGDSGAGGLLEICRIWQRALPNTEFLCPDAPFAYDMAPPDFGGRQWFSLREFTKESVEQGIKAASPILNEYIDQVLKDYHLKSSRLALVGFSQGTMMALHVALRRAEPMAAVVGYSGMLAGAESLVSEKKSSPAILLIHGTEDEVVPFGAMAVAENALKSLGVSIQTLACPHLAHSIDEVGIAKGLEFLKKYLNDETA